MIGMKVKVIDQAARVQEAMDRANFRNIGHAAATIRNTAIESIIPAKKGKASPAGTPPHTRFGRRGKGRKGGRRLQRAIRFHADRDGFSSIVGPIRSRFGTAGNVHEFGKFYKGSKYPARPFMGPALDAEVDRMPLYWLHSVGE